MAIVPATTVPAPEPLGQRYGLLTAAAGPLDLPTVGGYGGGVTYDPVSCGGAHRLAMDCLEPDPEDRPVKTFDPADPWITGVPFVTYASLTCGSVGYPGDTADTKVRRRLANGEQSQVEQELGAILVANADNVISGDPTRLSAVTGALEQWLYGGGVGEQGYGNVGFLHLPFRYSTQTALLDLRREDAGGRWRTKVGTVVVFGDYPDDGSIFITGHVTTWRASEPAVSPRAQVLDRTTNQLYMLAEREWVIAYDCAAGVATFTGEGVS